MAKLPARRDPRKLQQLPLEFDDKEEILVNTLSDEERCEVFLSKYMEKVDPIGRHPEYFDNSGFSLAHILKMVKQHYKTLVLHGRWSEPKYVAVVTEIFARDLTIGPYVFDQLSKLYEAGELESQAAAKARRKRRI